MTNAITELAKFVVAFGFGYYSMEWIGRKMKRG
jgi:hypothetical protein